MSGAGRWVSAGALALVLFGAGCKLSEFSLLAVSQIPASRDRVVAASMDSVSAGLLADLNRLGFAAFATPDGEAIRIHTSSKAGQRFSFLLTRVRTNGVEQTNVRVEWEGKPDRETETQILGRVETRPTP